jgi:N-acetylneuraminic acid mutarotase
MHRQTVGFLTLTLVLTACGPVAPIDAGADDAGAVSRDDAGLSDGGALSDAGNDEDAGPPPPDPTAFVAGPTMLKARVGHTATLLHDGRVLIVGGETGVNDANNPRVMMDDVEILDASASTFTALPAMRDPRSNHAAVLLDDGRVLIIGGGQATYSSQPAGTSATDSVLLFDPATDAMRTTAHLATARSHFGAAKLDDGRVLVAGGGAGTHVNGGNTCTNIPNCTPLADALDSVEIFDPATETWSDAPALHEKRFSFTLTAVGNRAYAIGGVTEAAGGISSVEIFDGATNTWSFGTSVVGPPREHHSAIATADGRVLVAGGKNPNVTPLDRVDAYDTLLDTWSAIGTLSGKRTSPTLARLPSGAILIMGGFEQLGAGTVATVERTDGVTVSPFAALDRARLAASATLLDDGTLLVCGGTVASGAATATCARAVP